MRDEKEKKIEKLSETFNKDNFISKVNHFLF